MTIQDYTPGRQPGGENNHYSTEDTGFTPQSRPPKQGESAPAGRNDLREAIRARPDELVGLLCGEGLRKGGEVVYRAPYREDEHPSLRWSPAKGTWFDDPVDKGGDVFDLVAIVHGLDVKKEFPAVLAKAAALLGIDGSASGPPPPPPRTTASSDGDPMGPEPTREQLATQYGLHWSDFASWGCTLERRHFSEAGRELPCVVYPIRLPDRSIAEKYKSTQRNARGKRLAVGAKGSGFTHGLFDCGLEDCEGATLVLTEGEEKALAIRVHTGKCAVSAGSADAFGELQAKMLVAAKPSRVVLAFDCDLAGTKGAKSAARQLHALGFTAVETVVWLGDTPAKWDVNDLLREKGPEALTDLIQFSAPINVQGASRESQATPAEPDSADGSSTSESHHDAPSRKLPLRNCTYFRDYEIPDTHWIVEGLISQRSIIGLIGPGGLGKSRFALQLATTLAVGGSDFLGFPVRRPVRVLYLQTENSIARLKSDLDGLSMCLTTTQIARLDMNLAIYTPTTAEDEDVDLTDPGAFARMAACVMEHRPDLVIIDPLIDFIGADNENSASDVARGLARIRQVCRIASPETAILLVHHARIGKEAVAGGFSQWETAAYARGSKALVSKVRLQINMLPGSEGDPDHPVLVCGKANDVKRFEPIGLRLDHATWTYHRNPGFDPDAYGREVSTARAVPKATPESARDALSGMGGRAKRQADLVREIETQCSVSRSRGNEVVREAIKRGLIDVAEDGQLVLPLSEPDN